MSKNNQTLIRGRTPSFLYPKVLTPTPPNSVPSSAICSSPRNRSAVATSGIRACIMLSVRHHLLYWAVSAAAAAAYASLAAVPLGQWHDAFFPAVIAALYLYRHVVRDWKWRFLRGSPGRTWYAAATFATLSSLGTAASLVAMLEPLADSGSSWRAVSAVHTLAALTALSVCEARRQRVRAVPPPIY